MQTSFSECVVLAKAELEAARQLLAREISAYPSPFSACDQQYNYLLAERRRIEGALSELATDFHIPTPRAP
jgi:lipase chaperone LimK